MLWRLDWCDSCLWWWLLNTTSYLGNVGMVRWRLVEILKLNFDQYCWEFVIWPRRSTQPLGLSCPGNVLCHNETLQSFYCTWNIDFTSIFIVNVVKAALRQHQKHPFTVIAMYWRAELWNKKKIYHLSLTNSIIPDHLCILMLIMVMQLMMGLTDLQLPPAYHVHKPG